MAIPFLNNITLNNNEIQNVRLQNASSPPLSSGSGQVYFNTGDTLAKYYSNVTDEFVSLKEYTFPTGNYVTGTVTGTTPKPIITFDLNAVDGTAAAGERYLTKNNTWAEVSSIPGTYTFEVAADSGTPETILDGDTLSIVGNTYITTVVSATDTVTINHDATDRTDTTSSDSPGYGGTFEAVTSVTTNATGHVTAVDVSTVTIPASDDTTYDLEGVGSTNGTAGVRLTETGTSNHDDVLIVGAGTTTVTRSANTLTVTSNDQFDGTVTSVSASTAGTALDVAVTNATIAPDLDFTWAGAPTDYVNGEGDLVPFPTIPGAYTWSIEGDSGGPTAVASGDAIDFAGGNNVTTALSGTTLTINSTDEFTGTLTGITEGPGITVTPSATSPTVAVDYLGSDNYLLEAGVATVASSEDIINFSDDSDSNVKKTTLGTIPVDSLTLVKNYIDSSASGGVYYQGGYNPVTDSTSPGNYGLQTPPNPNFIEIGWMYTVTADGTFFGEQVRVGDVLIAEIDAPTSLSDWTTVQNNIDLATDLVVGLGNVVPGSSNTITAPYSSGTATLDVVDSSPTQKGAVIVEAGTGISVSYASGTATVTNTQTNSDNTFSGTIGNGSATSIRLEDSGAVAPNINHGLGTDSTSFMIQLVDVSSGETVYADVTRGAGGQITISFAVAPATNDIRVLIQKIG